MKETDARWPRRFASRKETTPCRCEGARNLRRRSDHDSRQSRLDFPFRGWRLVGDGDAAAVADVMAAVVVVVVFKSFQHFVGIYLELAVRPPMSSKVSILESH